MSLQRQLSEIMQELKTVEQQKESLISGVKLGVSTSDWVHVKTCADKIIRADLLVMVKSEQAKELIIKIDEEREKEILEVIS